METTPYTPHVRVELKLTAKNAYHWDISLSLPEERAGEIGERLQEIDVDLRRRFGGAS